MMITALGIPSGIPWVTLQPIILSKKVANFFITCPLKLKFNTR
jgi:hypothetical protein